MLVNLFRSIERMMVMQRWWSWHNGEKNMIRNFFSISCCIAHM